MKVRFTYRMETYVDGKTWEDCVKQFETMNLETENSNYVEIISVENADTYEDLTNEYNETY